MESDAAATEKRGISDNILNSDDTVEKRGIADLLGSDDAAVAKRGEVEGILELSDKE